MGSRFLFSMRRIKLTQGFWATVDDEDFNRLCRFRWHIRSGYASRSTGANTFRFMHHDIVAPRHRMVVDHKNGNRLDNRRSNLRVCTPSENNANQVKRQGTSSRFKGVYWEAERGLWVTKVMNRQRHRVTIGRFKNEDVAGMAYDLWMLDMFGSFAQPNKPPVLYG